MNGKCPLDGNTLEKCVVDSMEVENVSNAWGSGLPKMKSAKLMSL